MLGTLLALTLTASPTAAQAAAFAKGKQWEELYLAFAAASPESTPKGDRGKIAQALLAGCRALEVDDAVMAFSLGEKSVAFSPSADALHCTALTAKRSDQRGAAEDALEKGSSAFPKDSRFQLELGRLYLEDGQPGEAASVLARIPAKAKESGEAKRLIAQIARDSGVSVGGPKLPVTNGASPVAETRGLPPATSRSYESGVDEDGRRVRQNQYFRFYYFNSKRDFGQRAEYEGRVQGALEDSRLAAQRLLGVAREKPVDVILYSREEFRLHHGPQASQSVAGFYSQDAIRMNDSAEINDRNRATLVHEYVHAVMDELGSFNQRSLPTWMHEGLAEYIEWRSEGAEGPPKGYATALQQLALQNQLPRLVEMSDGPLIASRNPGLAYALAAVAVRLLVEKRGMAEVIDLIRDCGRGTSFEKALESHFGTSVARLDEELTSSLK
ncbi:MAG: peptidase MA family metallohydrolase [Archangium sp.]|nr:peptidase MA family metallohydrolase [Archangium sp.]MDP3154107.1 peptidase MA family metallohydrolase [Archangium sp.]MDP3569989.1 peptidase MA family metallohydrolase [Archangium sp.]